MVLEIMTGTENPVLRKKTIEVKKITSKLKKAIKSMVETMDEKKGLGLAGPQVSILEKIIIVRLYSGNPEEIITPMINPEITFYSEEKIIAEEGCLSLPDCYIKVLRHAEITLHFVTIKGEKITLKLKDLNARVVQHEIDHLNGILITDKEINKSSSTLEE